MKNEQRLRELQGYHKRSNICATGVSGEEKKKYIGLENNSSAKMAGKFPNLSKDVNLQIQESEQTPNKINPKKTMPRQIPES